MRVLQHGQTAVWAVPQLGSCASSGHAWRLWAAWHSQIEAGSLSALPLLRVSSEPPPKAPIPRPLTTQVLRSALGELRVFVGEGGVLGGAGGGSAGGGEADLFAEEFWIEGVSDW